MDTKAKAETLEQKILEVLREEIGVEIGEEFDVYKKDNMLWRCKFEGNGFFCKGYYEFQKAEVWKNIIVNFHEYIFKRKPFIPKEHEEYWYVGISCNDNGDRIADVNRTVWVGILFDYGMLALGNAFRSEKEALKNKDKLLERLKKLQKGE